MSPGDRFTRMGAASLVAALLAVGAGIAFAAVDLSHFFVTPESGQVLLNWKTGSELDVAGFYVLRNSSDTRPYTGWPAIVVIDAATGMEDDFIEARNEFGATYDFVDIDLIDGTFYCYTLEVVNSDNTREWYAGTPACVTVGVLLPTATPTRDLTTTMTPSTPTSTPGGPTSTPTNTRTPLPATSTPLQTNTPVSSPTVPLFGTPQPSATATSTPLPTFLPTLTPTQSRTPTPSLTPTITATGGPLLDATRAPGAPPPGLGGLGGSSDVTLRTLIARVVAVTAALGGLLFAGLYFAISRRGGAGE
ncbi:MAG: hypothetical protein R3335_00030 [Anaerolineales bacterium]|nr:hypothetical protein [Anaerolineales bacterium]